MAKARKKKKASRKAASGRKKSSRKKAKATKKAPPVKTKTTAERTDEALARSALQKIQIGQTPTVREQNALARIEKARRDQMRAEIVSAIPKKDWLEWSGRQAKVVNEQADRYGFPLRGREIDLPAVVRRFHDFLAENASRLAQEGDDDLLGLAGVPLADRRKLLHETTRQKRYAADLAAINLRRAQQEVIDVDEFRKYWAMIRDKVSTAIDNLQRTYGRECAEIMAKAFEEADADARKVGRNDTDGTKKR